jgi:hypothetical protein
MSRPEGEDWRISLERITKDLENRYVKMLFELVFPLLVGIKQSRRVQPMSSLNWYIFISLHFVSKIYSYLQVETQERELQGGLLSVFVSDLNKSIAKLVKSNDSAHTYGGILAICMLI